MFSFAVNWLAVFLGAVASMVLGMLWYGPLFGKKWMDLMGMKMSDMDKMKGKMGMSYGMMFVGSLVMAFVLAVFIKSFGLMEMSQALTAGFLAWLGFIATVMLGMVLWDNKPWALYFLSVGFQLVNFLAVAAVISILG